MTQIALSLRREYVARLEALADAAAYMAGVFMALEGEDLEEGMTEVIAKALRVYREAAGE